MTFLYDDVEKLEFETKKTNCEEGKKARGKRENK